MLANLKAFARINSHKLVAWLVGGGAVIILDKLKTDVSNGTIVVPADWAMYVPVALTIGTVLVALLTPQAKKPPAPPVGLSQPNGTT